MKVITNLVEINETISITTLNVKSLNKLTKDREYWNGFKKWIKKLFLISTFNLEEANFNYKITEK